MLLPFRCHLPVSGLPQPTGQAFVQSHIFPTDSRRKVFVYWNDDKGQVIGRIILSLLIFVFGDRNWRPPPTYVITELQISLDLRKLILTGNNPDGPSSCCCKFLVVFSLPVSSAVRCRVLYRKTIGAGTSVRLGFPNVRPVVSDERSEEFRRSVKESLNGPVQANRSDGIKPGIGIERKNIPTF